MGQKPVYTNKTIFDLLHKVPFFSVFSEEDIRKMLYSGAFIRVERFLPGDIIIEEGTLGRWFYIIMRGDVRVMKEGLELSIVSEGEVIGEMGAVQNLLRSASVVAKDPCVCIAVNMAVVENMAGEERLDYAKRIHDYFQPLIRDRMKSMDQALELIREIRAKERELDTLRKKLKRLGANEERSLMDLLLSDKA